MPGLLPAVLMVAISSPAAPVEGQTVARYLALGDSYTIGESVAPGERWPVQLAVALNAAGLAMAPPEVIATTGWTTDELNRALDHEPPQGKFELVSLLIGVNNQYRGRRVEQFQLEFRSLLQRAAGYTTGDSARQVIVLSIPDWGVTPFATGRDRKQIADQIDLYNEIKRAETLNAGATWIDITDLTREAVHDRELLAADGLHPSGKDYARWARRALPAARKILSRP